MNLNYVTDLMQRLYDEDCEIACELLWNDGMWRVQFGDGCNRGESDKSEELTEAQFRQAIERYIPKLNDWIKVRPSYGHEVEVEKTIRKMLKLELKQGKELVA